MESFTKINNAIIEITEELTTIKAELEGDMNYSVNQAEIVTEIENVECMLHDIGVELNEVQINIADVNNDITFDPNDEDENED